MSAISLVARVDRLTLLIETLQDVCSEYEARFKDGNGRLFGPIDPTIENARRVLNEVLK